jgi:hypothetical protein
VRVAEKIAGVATMRVAAEIAGIRPRGPPTRWPTFDRGVDPFDAR